MSAKEDLIATLFIEDYEQKSEYDYLPNLHIMFYVANQLRKIKIFTEDEVGSALQICGDVDKVVREKLQIEGRTLAKHLPEARKIADEILSQYDNFTKEEQKV